MSRERELLKRALDALEEDQNYYWHKDLTADIHEELEKPEPVECGYVGVTDGALLGLRFNFSENGKYRLLAERIADE